MQASTMSGICGAGGAGVTDGGGVVVGSGVVVGGATTGTLTPMHTQ